MDITLDLDQLDANIGTFHDVASRAGTRVRGHLKAHRMREIAGRQVAAGAVGMAVQTAHAARALAEVDVTDVVVAWPWGEDWRFELYAESAEHVEQFAVHVAEAEQIVGVGAAASRRGVEVGVRIDLRHVAEQDVPRLARVADDTQGVRLDGLTCYTAPETVADIEARAELGRRTGERMVELATIVRAAGIACPTVAVGGTPTAAGAMSVPGVTEICAGAYTTWDGGLAALGVCASEDVALTVADEADPLLEGCTQPWSEQRHLVRADGRVLPAHICPFALAVLRSGAEVSVRQSGDEVDRWTAFAAPDRR